MADALSGASQVQGEAASDVAVVGNPVFVGGRASSAVPTSVDADGDAVGRWLDRSGAAIVNGRDAHDAALNSLTNPILVGGRASAAAPTDVSADGDAVRLWALRSGALATVLTAAGALIGGDSANGLDVDVTRVTGDVTVVQSTAANLNARVVGFQGHDGVGTSVNPVAIGGYASAAVPTDVSNDTDVVRAWYLRSGAAATVLTAAGALIGGDAANGLDVDVTRVTGTVTVDSELPAAAALADNTANPTVPGVGAYLMGFDGTNWDRMPGTSAAGVYVQGAIAHDAAVSGAGSPVLLAGEARNALPTAVANADVARLTADLFGRLLTTHIDPAQQIHKSFNATTTQTGTDVWSPASGKRIAVTSVVIGTYGTTAARIILWFGDNADTSYTPGTDQTLLAFSSAPSANTKPGLVFTPSVPVFCTVADRELHITTDAGISLDVTVEGYEW